MSSHTRVQGLWRWAIGADRAHREKGSAAIEAIFATLGLGLLISLIVLGGRIEMAKQAVQSAAYDAARSASISRSQPAAAIAGHAAGLQSLDDQGLHCRRTQVRIDSSAFNTPVGTTGAAAQVTATVSCVLRISDLGIPGLPATKTITQTMSSPLDAYRTREGWS